MFESEAQKLVTRPLHFSETQMGKMRMLGEIPLNPG